MMLKKKLINVVLMAVLAILASPVAYAQTPDGQTPAEETICDQLQVTGVSKGLYGLCVAFCEAQDLANITGPITLVHCIN